MSDAIIRANRYNANITYINETIYKYKLHTELITENTNYTIPNHVGNIYVRIFGGGGGDLVPGHILILMDYII